MGRRGAYPAAAMMVSLIRVNSSLSLEVQMNLTVEGTNAELMPLWRCCTMSSMTDSKGTACRGVIYYHCTWQP